MVVVATRREIVEKEVYLALLTQEEEAMTLMTLVIGEEEEIETIEGAVEEPPKEDITTDVLQVVEATVEVEARMSVAILQAVTTREEIRKIQKEHQDLVQDQGLDQGQEIEATTAHQVDVHIILKTNTQEVLKKTIRSKTTI